MCGRYANDASTDALRTLFEAGLDLGEDLAPSWNIAPTDPVRIVVQRRPRGADEAVRQLRTVRWGLVPSWSKSRKPNAKMINARSETVAEKFGAAAARRRALAPGLGYYEWQRTADGKTPYFLHAPGDGPLAFASLYEIWRDPDLDDDHPDKWLWTNTIITRPATDSLGHIHDRCPVIVPPDLWGDWLDCADEDAATAQRLLAEIGEPRLEPRIVSAAVGNVRNNGPQLIEPIDAPLG